VFTGLIEAVGRVAELGPRRGSTRIGIECPPLLERMERGDSVAVDGACLTVVGLTSDRFLADVVAETLARTTLGRLRPGHRVNLERALRVGDRLGGHLVQGHVDGVARVLEIRRRGDDHRVRLELTEAVRRYVAFKGSVTLHGVSLTVAAVDARSFEVAMIPETSARTTLGRIRVGDLLNVEVDLLARYLERLTAESGSRGNRRTPARGAGWRFDHE
jgi:riboflavin synthase